MRGWIEPLLIQKKIIDHSDKVVSSIRYQLQNLKFTAPTMSEKYIPENVNHE